MDRLLKLQGLVEQALDELARPNELAHEQFAAVATLHEISLEISALREDRLRLVGEAGRTGTVR